MLLGVSFLLLEGYIVVVVVAVVIIGVVTKVVILSIIFIIGSIRSGTRSLLRCAPLERQHSAGHFFGAHAGGVVAVSVLHIGVAEEESLASTIARKLILAA